MILIFLHGVRSVTDNISHCRGHDGHGTMPKTDAASFNLILPALLFVSTSLASIIEIKQRRNCYLLHRSLTFSSSRAVPAIPKERVLTLRNKYFSKSLSVSYANSDPLMIVKVKD
jgi:hypothetical protein